MKTKTFKILSLIIFIFFIFTDSYAQIFKNPPQKRPSSPLSNTSVSGSQSSPIPKSQQGGLVNLLIGGYNILGPNTLEFIVSAVSGPNDGRLTSQEENMTEVVIYLPLPKEVREQRPGLSSERKTFLLSNPQIRKEYLRGSTLYKIRVSDIASGGEFKVIVDPNNRIPEQNENDNQRIFMISSEAIAPSSFAKINLSVGGYRKVQPYTVDLTVHASSKLSFEDESKTQVVVTLPDNSKRTYVLSDRSIRKERPSTGGMNYILRLSNLTSGGEFKVEVDPLNLVRETDEKDNVKVFNISQQDLVPKARLDLFPDIYIKRTESRTVVFRVENRGMDLKPQEEENCMVRIFYPPHHQLTKKLTQFQKENLGADRYVYDLEISGIFEGGDFRIEVDSNNVIFETDESNNIKIVNIPIERLSLLRIVSPNSFLRVVSGSSLNMVWRYTRPQGFSAPLQFNYEILDSSGDVLSGPTPIYNPSQQDEETYSFDIRMPLNLGTYRIKLWIGDAYNSYDLTPSIEVVAALRPTNPQGFSIVSLPSEVQNGSDLTFSWTADPDIFSEVRKIHIFAPDLQSYMGWPSVRSYFLINSSSGTHSFPINIQPVEFDKKGRKDIVLKLELQRRQTDQIDYYITDVITVKR